jgi:hypothetical protein
MKDNIKKLEELFKQISHLSPDQVQGVVQEFVQTFEELIEQMQSANEKEREEAFAMAEQLRGSLEEQANKVLADSGLSYRELQNFANNPNNFSEDEWKALESAKAELNSYQTSLMDKGQSEKKKAPRKMPKSAWIHS